MRSLAYEYESGHAIVPHTHDWHQLVYATEGVMTVRTQDGTWVVPANRGVWVPAHLEHAIDISGRVSMRTLYVRPARRDSTPARCRTLTVSPLLRELILHAVSLGTLDSRKKEHVRLLGVILDQLDAIESRSLHLPEPRDPRAARIARLLHGDPSDRRPLKELVRGSGASQRTIERVFQRETRMSFARWRQQLRFFHALRLLASGEKVTSAALSVGYDSTSAFVSAFRRLFGVTPGRYFRTPG